MSLTRTAKPSRMPITPNWEMGFCSKNSVTNSEEYRRVRRYRVGRRSFSAIAIERSMMRIRWRMIPRWRGVVSLSSLGTLYQRHSFTVGLAISSPFSHLFRLPASSSPSTVELIVPSALSTTFSHVRVTSHPTPLFPCPDALVPFPAPRVT